MLKRARRGFTLLELIVVLVVLAIIALIAIPTFNNIIKGAASRAAVTTAQSITRDANSAGDLAGDVTEDADLLTAVQELGGTCKTADGGLNDVCNPSTGNNIFIKFTAASATARVDNTDSQVGQVAVMATSGGDETKACATVDYDAADELVEVTKDDTCTTFGAVPTR